MHFRDRAEAGRLLAQALKKYQKQDGVVYALPIILKEIGEEVWGIPFGYWAFAIPGLIVVVIGLVLLVRFIRENPIHAAEGA